LLKHGDKILFKLYSIKRNYEEVHIILREIKSCYIIDI
jgi:hypothetical protein